MSTTKDTALEALACHLLGQILPQLRHSGLVTAGDRRASGGTSAVARVDLTGRPQGASPGTVVDDRVLLALIAVEEVVSLAAISVRNLDDEVKERLRIRAARHGRSMESEIRAILTEAVTEPHDMDDLFQTMLDRFSQIGGVELELPPRVTPVRAAALSS